MTATETNIPSYQENVIGLIKQLGSMLPADKLALFNADAEQLAFTYRSPLKLQTGELAPFFALPNAKGEEINLADLLKHGPVVLTFYRGVWCPYCNLQLANYQKILPQIQKSGASLVAVSPMSADSSLNTVETNQLQFEVLSDIGNQVARQFTSVFKVGDQSIQAMSELGYDFLGFYGDESAEVPVPATFVIAQDGTILFAGSAGGDYRKRVEPKDILLALGV